MITTSKSDPMKKNTALLFITFILTFPTSNLLFGQQAVVTAGAEATGTGGTVSYSVGQVVYQTHASTSGSVAEGVQQPYEISVLSSTKDVAGISLTCSVYPNPTADYLTLKVENYTLLITFVISCLICRASYWKVKSLLPIRPIYR